MNLIDSIKDGVAKLEDPAEQCNPASKELVASMLGEIDRLKRESLDWDSTTGSARKWWEAFETENHERLTQVLRLCRELAQRKASITEFFLAYVYSNTDNIQANLFYLDYTRLKKEEEARRRKKDDGPR